MISVQAIPGIAFKVAPERVVATVAVAAGVMQTDPEAVIECLTRHFQGDWGDCSEDDKFTNDVALVDGDRLLSTYRVAGKAIWIVTDAREAGTPVTTTVMYPEDY